ANAEMMTLINGSHLDSIVVTPSNPFVSIDPILSLPGVRDALNAQTSPIIAVSPIVGGQAIKGPAAKMMAELGLPSTALAVAEHYRDLIDGIIIDEVDNEQADDIAALGMEVRVAQTVMRTLEDRKGLARICYAFGAEIGS
ncbi:MAG: 2-phospho-L-lactate transferase CofD family protein, partial [Pseudomonadota bacterium]|nr:2-phospho-L-lactate transferase CofD family protein [Pseudomonadota bacterium]